ncbi:MAG: DNA repair protein RadC [Bacilli bacterium]
MNDVMIENIPKEERPRERLLKYGANNLSNEELIAIILKTGIKNKSSKLLAKSILSKINKISDLKDITINKLLNIHGIGLVKAIELITALELGKRVFYNNEFKDKIKIRNAIDIYDLMKPILEGQKQEQFYCIYLDQKKYIIETKLIFIGSLNMSIVHPREVFKQAYLLSASSIICVHNHPSGITDPSNEDINITKKLTSTGNILGISVLDHIIIGNDYYSFHEKNNI